MKILYIDVDSLRPDHLGCYGYDRPTSPTVDRLAAEGARFDWCCASDGPCMPSRTATFTGRFGIVNGIVTHGERAQRARAERPSVQWYLTTHGIPATAISTFADQTDWFFHGWETYVRPMQGVG